MEHHRQSTLFGEEELNVVRRGLEKLVSLGLTGNPSTGEQLLKVYSDYSLKKLASEYWRTKCSLLGYIVVATSLGDRRHHKMAVRVLLSLEGSSGSQAFEERAKLRQMLRTELNAKRAE